MSSIIGLKKRFICSIMTGGKGHIVVFLASLWGGFAAFAQENVYYQKVDITADNTFITNTYIHNKDIGIQGWDNLPQVKFWRDIVRLSPDTGLLNITGSRQVLARMASTQWDMMGEAKRLKYLDSIQQAYNLTAEEQVLFTKGKSNFYQVEAVVPEITRAIKIFEEQEVDPFYAQAILLIESPGKLQKSNVGAYGPFQLMKGVAIRMGLKVNKYVDERKDFDKCAKGAARLLKTICIPEAKAMLERRHMTYDENALWFKLLVMHVYHAGAGNVAPAIDKSGVCEANEELIKKLWQTTHRAFRSASQNYTQVALATMLEFEEMVPKNYSAITYQPITKLYKSEQHGAPLIFTVDQIVEPAYAEDVYDLEVNINKVSNDNNKEPE